MTYSIGSFSERCHVNKETIRYYEKKHLLPDPNRTGAGYRIYSEEDIKRMKFIKHLQNLNFSLSEIYKLLGVVDKDAIRCKNMFEFVSKKEEEIAKRIEDLKKIEKLLKELSCKCPDEKELYACPIIDTLIDN